MTEQLKPCPFCGGAAEIQLDHGRNTIGVGCTVCVCCHIPSWSGDDAQYWAVKTWNTRHDPDQAWLDARDAEFDDRWNNR